MPSLASILPAEAFGFLLVFARMGMLFAVAPALGEQQVPARVRLALAVAVSLVTFLAVRSGLPAVPAGPLALAGLVIGEILIGLMIGGSARLLLSALNVGGTVLAFQSSLAFTQQFDPTQGSQSVLTAGFLTMLGIVMIFATDLHLLMIEAAVSSYGLFPAGARLPADDFASMVVDIVASSFLLGVQIAAPFLLFGLVFNIGLGFIARLMPQLPVFFVALPLNIFIGFLLLLVALPAMMMWFLGHFETHIQQFIG